jgi:hypothetical protein
LDVGRNGRHLTSTGCSLIFGPSPRKTAPASPTKSHRGAGRAFCGVGVAEITAARCECGRPIEPGDLELISEHQLRAVCAACHRDLFQITRTWWETSRNE